MVLKVSEHTDEIESDPIVVSDGLDANDDSDETVSFDDITVCSFVVVDVVVIGGMVVFSSTSPITVSFVDRVAKHCVSCVKVRLVSSWIVMPRLEANSSRFVHDDVSWLSVMSSGGFVLLESATGTVLLLLVNGTDGNDAVDDIIELKESSKEAVVVKSDLPDICGVGLKLSSN